MTPVRVLHVIDSMNPGGAQRVLLHLLQAMDPERFACDVAVLHGPGPLSAEFEQQGIVPLHLARSKWDPRIPFRLRRLIRANHYAIVHAHLVPSTFLCETFRRWLGIPRLAAHVHALYRFRRRYHYQNALESLLYHRANRVVACSQGTLDSVPLTSNGTVVYNGLGEDLLSRLAHGPSPDEARATLGLDVSGPIVGTVGRISPDKNLPLLCQMVARLARELPGIKGVLVGCGPEEEAVNALASRLSIKNRITITGFQPDVRLYLAAMDAFIMTSRAEGMPMAAIEAMAAGKACVFPESAWAQEMAINGTSALFYVQDDVESLATQVKRLLVDEQLRKRLGAEAQAVAQQRFSARRMAQDIARVYEEMLRP
jgi:glycosyltransferase involved in cell wall biosynthesis